MREKPIASLSPVSWMVLVGGIAVAVPLTVRWAVRRGLAAPCVRETATPATLGLPFQTVRIPTANGKALHGWLVLPVATGPVPAVVVVHGWGGNAQHMLPVAPLLRDAGFAVLLIDARCHGLSDSDSFASLPRFAEDASHARDWLARRRAVDAGRIAFLGHSVGASAVLFAAAQRGGVCAVVSVSAFAHPAEMMRRWLGTKRIPAIMVDWLLGYVERTIAHRFDEIAPLTSIARLDCPVLIVHGEQDHVVPLADALRLHAAGRAGRVEFLRLQGDHESFDGLEREFAAVVRFLRAALPEGNLGYQRSDEIRQHQ